MLFGFDVGRKLFSCLFSQACSYPCQCPSQAPLCPLGNSLLLDGCGCCRVCSRQLGELCSWQDPCDHHKGLYCDFSLNQKDSGICFVQNKCCEEWVCEGSHQKTPYEKGMDSKCGLTKPELKLKSILNDLQVNCLVQTTEWSVCSKTCGLGISTCVTNDNPQCQLEKESRLYKLDRICQESPEFRKRCLQNPKSHEAINFEFIGCTSVHSYWPKSCGSLEVEFQCPEGESFVRKMMFIKSCSFHFDCPAGNDVFLATSKGPELFLQNKWCCC
uniref:IGFBP N-terminal domain-containing protein n=1 Tax=Laticauda laticaudata TaxID=8630 RepID=A0A8C5SLJ7_LATLA